METKKVVYLAIFGFTGDLFKRKLLKALWEIWNESQKPGSNTEIRVVLTGSKKLLQGDELKIKLEDFESEFPFLRKELHKKQWSKFLDTFEHIPGRCSVKEDFAPMGRRFKEILALGPNVHLRYFFSIPHDGYIPTLENLATKEFELSGDESSRCWMLLEKPAAIKLEDIERLRQLIISYNLPMSHVRIVEHFAFKEGYRKFLDAAYSGIKNQLLRSDHGLKEVFWLCQEMIGTEGRAYPGVVIDSVLNHMATMLASSLTAPFDNGRQESWPSRIRDGLRCLYYAAPGEVGALSEEELFERREAFYKELGMRFMPAFCIEDYSNNLEGSAARVVPTAFYMEFRPRNVRFDGSTVFRMVHAKNAIRKTLLVDYRYENGHSSRHFIEEHDAWLTYPDLRNDNRPLAWFGSQERENRQRLDHVHSLFRIERSGTQVPPELGDGYRRLLELFATADRPEQLWPFNTLEMQENALQVFGPIQEIIDSLPASELDPKTAKRVVWYHKGTDPFSVKGTLTKERLFLLTA